MKKTNKMTTKAIVLVLALAIFVGVFAVGCSTDSGSGGIQEIPAQDNYTYVNPDETLAETDAGFVIDGVLDEEAYQNNNWLYLSNKDGGADVEIAMTSYFGEKGMYFVYDVTEGNPIYVNLDRASYLNSCVEMYLAPSTVNNMKGNSVFEIDLLPTGDMTFKKSNGKGQFVNVATTKDMMAVLGATTKGGELNTEDCYGYCLELFIPWEYMDKFDLNAAAMKESYVYVDPAHITSFNYAGTNMDVDRYWYFFAQENGASWNNVYQYFRFDGKGVQGTVPVEFESGEHYTVEGANSAIPGMKMNVTITPDAGYALKSILINGEEYIQEADFNADGSVTLRERVAAGGTKISAEAEAITEGNKTLTGTVIANKLGGGDLKNITASYKGPNGETPLELDKDGNFVLADLKQGLYTIVLEKTGYQKLTRSIYVNRDMEVVLPLEYDLFEASAYGWVLDDQNEGILHKFGGDGQLLTKDLYDQFTVSATFRFDEALSENGDFGSFQEQRKGFQIAFDNGKIWHIDLLKQDGKFYVQYAKHSGDNSLTGWKKVYELTEREVEHYTGDGIELSIKRAGKYANVYLDGKLIAQEIFDNEYMNRKAQVGFEAWTANREIMEVPFQIQPTVNVALHNTFFKMKDGWDVSGQYHGVIAKTGNGGKRLTFINKYVNLDLTVTARDYPNSTDKEGVYPRTDILFEFDNGKQMSFGITTDGKTARVQSMYDAAAADKYVNTGWQTWGNLTDEELAQLQNGGVAFRVVRYGTEVTLYVGDRMVAVADLTANNSGITAGTPAKVNIRHYDDAGVRVEIPFKVSTTFDLVNVTTGNNLATEKQQYFAGDTVKITAKDDSNYISSLQVNGKDVTVNFDGTYSFVAAEKEYSVTGNVAKSIFKPDSQWDILQQNAGVISIPERTGSYASIYTSDSTYRDASILVQDLNPTASSGKGNYQMQIRFILANGKEYQIRLHNTNKVDTYEIQSMGGTNCITGWKWHVNLTPEQAAKLRSEGVEFRVAMVGTDARMYIDDVEVATYSLASGGITADTTAQIRFMTYGNTGVRNLKLPFELGGAPKTATVSIASGIENGTITTGKKDSVAIAGEKITVTATPDAGYNLNELSVTKDGKAVDLGDVSVSGGSYTFTVEEGKYVIDGEFTSRIFLDTEYFDLKQQHEGVVTLLAGSTKARTLKTETNTYGDIAVTVRDYEKGTFKTEFHFTFTNGKTFQIRLDNEKGYYRVQNMAAGIINSWPTVYKLDDAQSAKVTSEAGIEFRVAIIGSYAKVYLDGTEVGTLDLSAGISKETAQIAVVFYGNDGVQNIKIPYTLGMGSAASHVEVASGITGGKVTADKTVCAAGETVTITATPDENYNLTGLTVTKDGKAVDIGKVTFAGGTYSFVAEEGSYSINATFAVKVFQDTEYYDLTNQYNGSVLLLEGATGARSLKTVGNTYRDVSVTVRDQESGTFKTEFHFTFTNGKKFQIRLDNEAGYYRVQNMGGSSMIVTGWTKVHTLTDDQIAQLKSAEGLNYRVTLLDNFAIVYLGSTEVGRLDLSAGNVATETAQINIVLYGNSGKKNVTIPFTLGQGAKAAKVTINTAANGTVTADKTVCIAGETVTLTATPAEGYNLKSLTVTKDGKAVDLGKIDLTGGTYSFVAEEGSYNVSVVFAAKIFEDTTYYDLTNQYDGSVTLLQGSTSARTLKTVGNTYRDISVTVRDQESGTFKTEFHFTFTNGKKFQIRLDNEAGYYRVQNMGGSSMIVTGWTKVHTLTDDQIAQLKSASGMNYRVSIAGTSAIVYLNDIEVGKLDLSAGITTETAQISVVLYGNNGVQNIQIPYTLSSGPAMATIETAATTNGTITLDKTVCTAGETVTITAAPAEGYNLTSLTVKKDGQVVKTFETEFAGGSYSFVTEEGSYTVEGQFAKPVFYIGTGSNDIDDKWDFVQQYNGKVKVSRAGTYARLYTTEKTYRSVSVTVNDFTPTFASDGKGNFKMQVYFDFGSAGQFQIRLHNENTDSKYKVQKMGNTFSSGWSAWYTLTDAEVDQLQNGSGVNFRVALEGSKAVAYINGAKVGEIDLSGKVDASTTAQIILIMYGNNGQAFEIPFTLG